MTTTTSTRRALTRLGAVSLAGTSLLGFGFVASVGAAVNTPVSIKSFQYMPGEVTVAKGTTVQWTNQDQILHTATSGTPGAPSGAFGGEMDGVGKTFSHQFNQPGEYAYYCTRHESMLGKVIVR